MWKRRGLVGLASLLFCLWGAADAQSPGAGSNTPPQLRVGDLPPEVRAQLPADLSPDTLLVGPPNSDGDAVYADPSVLQALELPPSIAAEVDAVVAAESMQLLPVHFRLAGPFAAGAPFDARFPPGTDIKQLVEEGEIRNCIRQHGTYTPPEDENGEIYPGICLEDRDGDGAYETALFLPYLDQFPPRTIAIEPVRLEPNPAAMTADREAFSVQRRIRVAALESGVVRLVLEHGLAPTYRPDRGRFDSGPDDSVYLAVAARRRRGARRHHRPCRARWRHLAPGALRTISVVAAGSRSWPSHHCRFAGVSPATFAVLTPVLPPFDV
jgi:hypothetical protein